MRLFNLRRQYRWALIGLLAALLIASALVIQLAFKGESAETAPLTQSQSHQNLKALQALVTAPIADAKVVAAKEAKADEVEELEEAEEPAPSYDIDTPSSFTVVTNKQRPMNPVDWAPDDLVLPAGIPNPSGHTLRAEAAQALEAMQAEANAAGLGFSIVSGFRSYWTQLDLYASYAAAYGGDSADTFSARGGHSEHQTGLVVDLDDGAGCHLSACFGETGTGLWLRENAHRFGYILRYDEGQDGITGYKYEPWHFRYVGVDVATAMHEAGEKNLEIFMGLDPTPGY